MSHGGQANDFRLRRLLGKFVERVRAADFVFLSLQRDPGLLQRFCRLQDQFALFRFGLPGRIAQPRAGAQRRAAEVLQRPLASA